MAETHSLNHIVERMYADVAQFDATRQAQGFVARGRGTRFLRPGYQEALPHILSPDVAVLHTDHPEDWQPAEASGVDAERIVEHEEEY